MKNILKKAIELNKQLSEIDNELTTHVKEKFDSVSKVIMRGDFIMVDMVGGYDFSFSCNSAKIIAGRMDMNIVGIAEYIKQSEIEANLIFADIKKYCEG